jgi:hypothetical protein
MSAGGQNIYDTTPRLLPKDLFEQRKKRDQARLRAYNQLLNQINTRIYTTAQIPNNNNEIMYTIPPFILGLPKIDLEDCVVYLVYMLRKAGFFVRYTYPNLLYISWKHHERDYLLSQNPIVQAMLPPEAKKPMTGRKKAVSFAPAEAPEEGAPVRRNAADYVPPNSFIQSMTRPEPTRTKKVLDDLWNF